MPTKMTYEKSGVPHLKGDVSYNKKIVQLIRSTSNKGVLGNRTGFASVFDLKRFGMKDPLLVSATDGVGTKLELAGLQKKHDTVGIDLVAMSVNDLITVGARPLFFLDYFATGKFNSSMTFEVLKGITKGCKQSGCALVGGETAIMPGFYQSSGDGFCDYDLAGFAVGVVERKKLITGQKIKAGDLLIGMASSGFHSNGFSLLRKLYSKKQLRGSLGAKFLTPTQIYVKPIEALLEKVPVRGIVNITGGGFMDNLPRVVPDSLKSMIQIGSWRQPKLFDFVRDSGNISPLEMCRTFNVGIGMIVIVPPREKEQTQRILKRAEITSWVIGQAEKRSRSEKKVQLVK